MIVNCPRCQTKYNLPDEKITEAVTLRCARCDFEFDFTPAPVLEEDDDLQLLSSLEDEFDQADGQLAEEGEEDKGDLPQTVEEDLFAASADEVQVASEAEDGDDQGVDLEAFELAEDFDAELQDDFLDDQNPALDPVAPEKEQEPDFSSPEAKTREPENLSLDLDNLDLDDLDLGDVEFDNFDVDDQATADGGESDGSAGGRATQLDDEGDLESLFGDEADAAPPADSFDAAATDHEVVELEPVADSKARPSSGKGRRRYFLLALSFFVLSLGLWAAYAIWNHYSIDMKKHLQIVDVENRRLLLPSQRRVIILRGRLLNTSPKEISDLKIRGVILDAEGQELASATTAGGVSFSEQELDLLDGAKLALLENPAVVLPGNGGELSFMLAFYDYPESAQECFVEILSFKVKKSRRF